MERIDGQTASSFLLTAAALTLAVIENFVFSSFAEERALLVKTKR
jgi:hypothetical protein